MSKLLRVASTLWRQDRIFRWAVLLVPVLAAVAYHVSASRALLHPRTVYIPTAPAPSAPAQPPAPAWVPPAPGPAPQPGAPPQPPAARGGASRHSPIHLAPGQPLLPPGSAPAQAPAQQPPAYQSPFDR